MKAPTEFGWSTYGEDPICIAVRGEIDLDSAPKLSHAIGELVERGYRHLGLDLGAVEFMDSKGVHVLVDMCERLQDAGGQLVLSEASAQVRRVLALTGLDRLLPLPEGPAPPTAGGPTGPS